MKKTYYRKITKFELSKVRIDVPVEGNKILQEVLDRINSNDEIKTLWKVVNVNASTRLKMTDHGPIHFQVVANTALKIARILKKKGIEMSIVKDLGLTNDHAEVVIFLASIMHDLGMSIHRVSHEIFSLFISNNLLKDILSFLPTEERVVVTSETLHAIISHSHGSAGKTSTIEGGVVRIADALDITEGRARTSYKLGNLDIHSVSHNSIKSVDILPGEEAVLQINMYMTNPAGIFQIDDFIQEKLSVSGLAKYTKVKAYIEEEGVTKIFKEYDFKGSK